MTIDIGVTAQQLSTDDQPVIRGGQVEFNTVGTETIKTHTFSTSEEIIVEKEGIVDILLVAGGGGGGSDNGGGGGAGGVVYRTGYAQLETGTYSVVVGAGGAGAPASAGQTSGDPASKGSNSELIFIPENYVDTSGSVVLNGTSGYLISADNPALRIGTDNFTVEAWVNVNDYKLYNVIASKSGATTAEGWFFATADNADLNRKLLTESNIQPKTLEFKDDGTAFYTVENNTVYQYDMSTAWDLSTAQQKPQFSVNPPEATPRGTFFRADGEKFYLTGNTGDRVSQFMLRTPWSIKSAVLENSSTVIPDTLPFAVQFSPDGLNMFVLGRTNVRIFYYTLTIAWDITTAVNTTQFLSLSAITTAPGDFYFRPDGFRIYVLSDSVPRTVYRYDLSTAWDISTATLSTDIRDIEPETSPTAIRFKPDGTIMYIMGSSGDVVRQYELSEPWTIGTASYRIGKHVAAQEISPNGFYFRPDGKFLYVIGATSDRIHRYELVVAWDASRQVNFIDSSLSYAAFETTAESVYWKPDGTGFFFVGVTADTVYERSVTVPWTFQDEVDVANFPVTGEGNPRGLTFKADGSRMYVVGTSTDLVMQYDLATAWSLSSVVAAGTFSVQAQDTSPQGVELSYDGTKLYMIGIASSTVYEYDLSTAWDVTTATVNSSFLLTPYGSDWTEVRFKDDGTVMHVLGTGNDRIVQFDLSTPWSISTATIPADKALGVAALEGAPNILDFDSTGTKLYVGGTGVDTVFELDLLIPWEITSAAYLGDIKDLSAQDSDVGGVAFNLNGTKMFASGSANTSIYSYNLSTPWKVSTAVFDQSKTITELSTLTTVKFSADGDKLFVLDQLDQSLLEYTLSTEWDISTATFTTLISLSGIENSPVDIKFKIDGSEFYIVGLSRKVSAYELTTPWSLADVVYKNSVDISSESNIPSGIGFSYTGDTMYALDRATVTIYEYNLEQDWEITNFTDTVGKLHWEFQDEIFVSTQRVETKTWTHVAASRQSGVLKLFVNGSLSGEFGDVKNYASTGEFRIGRGRGSSTNYFNGAISNFRLTPSGLYNNNFQVPTLPLTASVITSLLTANNTFSFADASSNNLTVTSAGEITVSALSPFAYTTTLKPELITYGGGGGNSGQTTVPSRSGGLAGGSGGGGQGESPWTTYNTGSGGEALQSIRPGYFSNTFDLESRLVIANNNLFDFSYNIDYTIETWFYLDGDSPTTGLGFRRATIISGIAEAAGSTNSFEFLINGTGTVTGTGLYVGLRNNSTTLVEYSYPATIEKYKWHHAAFSKKENVMSVYLNGVKIGRSIDFTMETTPGPNPIKIASVFSSGTGFQPLVGKLSNLRVSRGIARYQGESFTLPTAPFTDDTYTILLTCQSEDFKDSSRHQLSIARTGAVRITSSMTPFVKKTLFSAAFKNSAYLRVDSAISSFTTATQPWTIECWLNESQQAAIAYFIGINSIAAGANTILVRFDAVFVGTTTYTFSESFTTGQWNHFAMTYNGTALKVYKNGVSVLNQTIALPALYLSVFGIATEFDAANGGTPGDYYAGYIHDFRVVNSVVYTENFTPPTGLLEDIPGTTLLCLRSDRFIDDSSAKCPITVFNNPRIENIHPYSSTLDQYQAATEDVIITNPEYGSLEFNGTNSYIDAASDFSIGTSDFTVEFWCKFTNATADTASRRILSQGANNAAAVQVYIVEANRTINGIAVPRGTISFYTTADVISVVKRVDDGKWHHIAFSREGTTLMSFLDGELMDTMTNSTNFTSTLGYRIGTVATSATSGNYQGKLSNIRISLFTARYTETFTPLSDNFTVSFESIDYQIETKLLIQGQDLADLSVSGYLLTAAGELAVGDDSPFLQSQTITPRNFKLALKSYGNSGGITVTGTTQIGGAGGGGASEPGNPPSGTVGGTGGAGILIPLNGQYYAGGGGGGNSNDITDEVLGGLGGGGLGGASTDLGFHNAVVGTGGGGGGSAALSPGIFISGGNGGSGVIKITYRSEKPIAVKNTDIELVSGIAVSKIPVTVIGPSESYLFSISPALPTGLNFNTATGRITGSTTELVDIVYTVTVTDPDDASLQDFDTFRLIVESSNRAVGGDEFIYDDGAVVYRVHKLISSTNLVFAGPGPFEYYAIGGGGAGGGGSGTLDGDGGGGGGGLVVGIKNFTPSEKTPTIVYADSDTQDQGWDEGTDFIGESGVVNFVKTVSDTVNQISTGGARTIGLPDINGYVEFKINQHENVSIGICRTTSAGGQSNIPNVNLSTGNLEGTASSTQSLSRFIKGDILQLLFDSDGRVYFGKNNVWSNRYQTFEGDLAPGVGPLQIVVLSNQAVESTATLDAEFLKSNSHTYSAPVGYFALGQDVAIVPVVIGAGAAGSVATGLNGSDSSIFDAVALGGGGGATFDGVGIAGGSGGGAGGRNTRAGGAALQPTSISGGYGSAGGASSPTSATGSNAGGGGGGIPSVEITITSEIVVGGTTSVIEQDGIFYRVHTFDSTDVFYVSENVLVDMLIVAGGGGGGFGRVGNHLGGGGGAGGARYYENISVSAGQQYIVTVGAGGTVRTQGSSSSIAGVDGIISPTGGGFGGGGGDFAGGFGGISPTSGGNGGSGGGGSGGNDGGTGIAGEGFAGAFGGGGGGAGSVGVSATGSPATGGPGGVGLEFDITGTATYYAGGGGFGGGGAGGLGGGGTGGTESPPILAVSGTANTGGGGGGGTAVSGFEFGAAGGSGIVIIKYQIPVDEDSNNFVIQQPTSIISTNGANATLGGGGAGGGGAQLFDGIIYGAGGGASGQNSSGLGGSLYAGEGAISAGLVGASSGIVNTGSGGGGSWSSTTNGGLGGNGGSGVAFIKYRIS